MRANPALLACIILGWPMTASAESAPLFGDIEARAPKAEIASRLGPCPDTSGVNCLIDPPLLWEQKVVVEIAFNEADEVEAAIARLVEPIEPGKVFTHLVDGQFFPLVLRTGEDEIDVWPYVRKGQSAYFGLIFGAAVVRSADTGEDFEFDTVAFETPGPVALYSPTARAARAAAGPTDRTATATVNKKTNKAAIRFSTVGMLRLKEYRAKQPK